MKAEKIVEEFDSALRVAYGRTAASHEQAMIAEADFDQSEGMLSQAESDCAVAKERARAALEAHSEASRRLLMYEEQEANVMKSLGRAAHNEEDSFSATRRAEESK